MFGEAVAVGRPGELDPYQLRVGGIFGKEDSEVVVRAGTVGEVEPFVGLADEAVDGLVIFLAGVRAVRVVDAGLAPEMSSSVTCRA